MLHLVATTATIGLLAAACTAAREEPAPVAESGAATPPAVAGQVDGATVRDVLASPGLVGRTVRVAGRCLGYAAAQAAGPPPRTRSDWQLAADGAAVWVTGPRPAGCATDGAAADGVIEARVAEDTIPSLTGGAGRARRYLVRAPR